MVSKPAGFIANIKLDPFKEFGGDDWLKCTLHLLTFQHKNSGVNPAPEHFVDDLLSDFVSFGRSKSDTVSHSSYLGFFINPLGIFLKKFFDDRCSLRIGYNRFMSSWLHNVAVANWSDPRNLPLAHTLSYSVFGAFCFGIVIKLGE
ncbi:MAG: hypothetical protein ABSC29_00320 [Minisyncoccia bacterium]